MVREYLGLGVGLALAALLPGCSLILDFSNRAIPKDAAIDSRFPAAECAYGEPNDTPDTAFQIQPGDTGPAAICSGGDAGGDDVDYYRFVVPTGTMSTTIAISFSNALGDLDLALYDGNATFLTASRGFSDGETIICPGTTPSCAALQPGAYIFQVLGATAGVQNDYTFSVATQ